MNLILKNFPTTRYQGSKRKLLPWIYEHISSLRFNSALDVFGGTASVSYLFKRMGKQVTYNDYLKFNSYIGKSLIENDNILLTEQDINFLIKKHPGVKYSSFVKDTFKNIYYTNSENNWIDIFLCNWEKFAEPYPKRIREYKKALAFSAFCQSAIKKRPFNLFHRANLYLRFNDVKRNFGNKTSWDGLFEVYFRNFCSELNSHVFSNGQKHLTLNLNSSNLNNENKYDLVYVDPPYIRKEAVGSDVNYFQFYHFLEGACDKKAWKNRINYESKNLRLMNGEVNEWIYPKLNLIAFEKLFNTFRRSTIVISYKNPGIPSRVELIKSLKRYKKRVISIPGKKYDYALNKNNGFHREYMLIGIDR